MKRLTLLGLALLSLSSAAVAQTDHDNIDAGRPLRFDDAEPISFGGLAFEFGLMSSFFRRRSPIYEVPFELIYGGFMDTQLEVGLSGRFGNRVGTNLGPLDFGILHSFRRETRNSPALALKAEAELPTDRGGATEYRLRGILSQAVRQYDRFHLNLDVDFAPNAAADELKTRFGAILGYTKPIGYPTHFDTTAVAELGIRQAERRGDPALMSLGLGIRRQVTPRSVFDIGIQTEFGLGRRGDNTPIRLVAGYSTSF